MGSYFAACFDRQTILMKSTLVSHPFVSTKLATADGADLGLFVATLAQEMPGLALKIDHDYD